ncbi:MAG: hypothetical protein AAF797_12825 [Planctomycetota bacterium]
MLSIPRDELPLLLVMGGLIFLSLVVAPIVFFYFLFRSERRQQEEVAEGLFRRVEGGVKEGVALVRVEADRAPGVPGEGLAWFEQAGASLSEAGLGVLGDAVVRVPVRGGETREVAYRRAWVAADGLSVAVLEWLMPAVMPVGVELKGPEPVTRTVSVWSQTEAGEVWVTRDAVTVRTTSPDDVRVWVVGLGFPASQYAASHAAFLKENGVEGLKPLDTFEAYAALVEVERGLVRRHRESFGYLDRRELATIQGVPEGDVEPRLVAAVDRIKRQQGLPMGVRG